MKTLNYLIVEIDQAYQNELQLQNGKSIIVNTTIESVSNITRKAKVLSAPDYTILEKGDEVIVHHNIFRKRNGYQGKIVNSNYLIEGKKYYVPLTEVFMYKRGKIWKALDPYCFIKPIESKDDIQHNGFLLSDSFKKDLLHKGNVKLQGIVKYPNQSMLDWGIQEGDKVIFSPYSEYEFQIDNNLYYRMKTTDIRIKL